VRISFVHGIKKNFTGGSVEIHYRVESTRSLGRFAKLVIAFGINIKVSSVFPHSKSRFFAHIRGNSQRIARDVKHGFDW